MLFFQYNCSVSHIAEASEKCELEYRQYDNKSCTFRQFRHQENSVGCAKIKKFEFEDPSTDTKLSINTLMEKVRPIVLEK